ncbi:PAS domain-containing protein [Magnetospirillum sp. J10]|uniref:histidine kinase n=2 Tax=Magnetospirillum sulfuroxidans TaxID=611300 RepID=A0ABS5I6R8_9PROT|nr:PAS domain-containing protein [Magnetospirillum sulfuroxidans]
MITALRRHMTLTRAWLALVMLLCLAVLVWDAVRSYADHRRQTVDRLTALARVVEARTELTFQSLDLLLLETANQLPQGLVMPGDPDYLRFLKGRSFIFTDALTLSVVSPEGVIEHSSNPTLVGRPVGSRDYLDHFRAHPDDTRLFISKPAITVTNRPIIFIARAIRHDDGRLRAIALTGINPQLLGSLMKPALPSEASGAIAVLNRDGIVLARYPELNNTPPGASLAHTPMFQAHRASGRDLSVLQGGGGPDEFERLLVMRDVSQFGLVVVVTLSSRDLLDPAIDTVLADLVFLFIVGGVIVVLGRFLGGRERQRQKNQSEIALARDYYMRVLDHLPVHIWRSDILGQIDYANGTLQTFLGQPVDTLTAFLHPDDMAAWQDMATTRLSRGENSEQEYRLRRHDGQYRWMHEIAQPFHDQDGRFAGHLAACLDITDTRAVQEKLTQSNAELEQFAYVASHDLREPLRMVSSYMGLIERRLGAEANAELMEFLAFAKDGATRMDKLILDLLQYSRIGRMSAPKRDVDLAQSLSVALSNLGVMIDESRARICIGALPVVHASDDDMVRLLQNLIGNAIKYALPETPPQISIGATRENGSWRFSIHDNGIGIDHSYFDRVFRIFQRLHARDEHGGGSGIGLSICKKIVESHGGRIWVDSPGPNLGTTFFFTLPATNV